ncbi:MAG: hypothetical protein HKP58_11580 [Desulfatitalea sp.]|nr:enoyl-CoA hydratase/isomerase family protein [Desulfatitalea sp.]NNK01044.1 hypothetical protein [Desulfatitalea sp.]
MDLIKCEQLDAVTIIRMCFESKMNALEKAFREALKSSLRAFNNDANSRVAILTNTGKAFCAGGSLNEVGGGMSAAGGVDYMKDVNEIACILTTLDKPVIAAVNGAAIGAGFNLALACDLVVAAENAIFSCGFAKIGLIPDFGGHYFLPRIVGMHKAKEVIFTGASLDAKKACEMGFVNHVVPAQELMPFTMDLAAQIAAGPAKAIEMSKTILSKSMERSLEDTLAYEAFAQAICFQSDDHKEGVKAFFEKRNPEFNRK